MNKIFKSVLLLAVPFVSVAAPVTSDEAAQAVRTWVGFGAQLGCRLGEAVSGARTCSPTNGVTFHVVKLEGGGFVVTSSDTDTEPILAFSESDDFVESERNPLWTMLRRDLSACATRRRQVQFASSGASASALSAPEAKWARLLPAKGTNGLMRTLSAATGKDTLSDVRVAPLIQTKWSQAQDSYYSNLGDPCYNYYTPNNFPCGCVATATAQIMRYHRFPTASVTPGSYKCRVETGKNRVTQTSYYPIYEDRTLQMQGGVYDWNAMPLVPADGTTLAQRQAIGKLTSDVGITCLMSYGEYGSSSGGYMAARSLPERFGYASAVAACGDGLTAAFVRKVLVSNLDAKLPVLLGMSGGSGGHAVVADGYGYSLSTFYAHFNLGWAGKDDAWYAPPNVEDYSSVDSMVYNIYPGGVANGVICSGRVLSQSGSPVKGATVRASGTVTATVTTDANGVYAFVLAPGSYEVSSGDASQSVTLVANVGTAVTDDGYYYSSPVAAVNNVCDLDLTVSGTVPPEEEPVVSGVRAGAWTTDAAAVKAARDCKLVVVLCANYGGCGWSQRAQPVFESKQFLDWAAENGVYLVTSDSSRLPAGCTDADAASRWFWTLYGSVSHPDGYVYYPSIAIARPDDFDQAVGYDVVRSDGECTVGGLVYEGTADSLIAGLSAYVVGEPHEVEGESWTDPISGIVWIYSVDASGNVTLLGVSQSGRTLILPEEVDGRPVVAIGDKAFARLEAEAVVVPENIESVGANAFSSCTSLVQIDFEGEPPTGLVAAGFPAMTLVRYNDAYEDAWIKALADAGLTNVSSYHPLMDLDWDWEYCDDGVRITGIEDLWYEDHELGEVRIPSSLNGRPVTEIGGGMMEHFGIFGTYEDSFATAITISDGVRAIGDFVFDSCESLTTVRIPESVTRIGRQAFSRCTNLTNVTLPRRLQSIDVHAFSYCHGLSTVTVPAAVTNLGLAVFASCRNLQSIEVDAANQFYASVDGVLYDKEIQTLLQCPAGISSVKIPNTVKRFSELSFMFCERLESLHIPVAVSEIEPGAFLLCMSLKNLTVDSKNKSFSVQKGILYDYQKEELVFCLPTQETVDILPSVKRISEEAFGGCTNLAEIALPDGVREIGEGAFDECFSLESITIPAGVTTIPNMAFYMCRNLKEVQLLGAVTNIGSDAFHSCWSLESVTLPASVKHIGYRAFEWCESLALTFEGAPPQVDGGWDAWSGPFGGCMCGYYSAFRDQWEAEIDEDGKWHGLDMYYEGPEDSGVASFSHGEASAAKGGAFRLTVYGGSDESAASVKVAVAYGNAKAADLVLKNASVSGAGGVEKTNLKFPLTLSWAQGDTVPKTIVIPVAAGKAADAPKFLTWNLTDAKGLALGEFTSCFATIAPGEKWSGGDVYVMPTVADAAGGKVSGGAGVKPDKKGAYKAVTLKATANKGYWFAGWYGADGKPASGDLSFKVTPKGGEDLETFEARFVPAQPSLCGTYNGYARVNLKGMTCVKNADTSGDVVGEYPMTVTLSTAGKLSGSVTVGGKKVSFKADGCCEISDDGEGDEWATFRFPVEEKPWFGKGNVETLQLEISRSISEGKYEEYGVARLGGVSSTGAYEPLGEEQSGFAYRNVDKSDVKLLAPFVGTYVAALDCGDEGVIPLSVGIDKNGKVKASGRHLDGSALTMSGVLAYRFSNEAWEQGRDPYEDAIVHLFAVPKALGGGALHVTASLTHQGSLGNVDVETWGKVTRYAASGVRAFDESSSVASRYSSSCWFPADADPDFGVVQLASGGDVVDILYASKNGKITGLGKATSKDYAVKFDAKTGLFTVTKGKAYTIQGVLGDYEGGCCKAVRINADKTCEPVDIAFETLSTPEESFPWADDGFELTFGQNFGEDLQPSVLSEGKPLALTVSGLPAGLKYDKKTGLITGAPTKAGTFKVKVGYTCATRKITRETTLVVAPKPEGLPVGTYAGYATVFVDGTNREQRVDCPFTATIDKNGALSGSITLFGKKATFKASGYDYGSEGLSYYTATLDLKSIDKAWGVTTFSLKVSSNDVHVFADELFGNRYEIWSVTAWRDQTKDADRTVRVVPYVGTYVAALSPAVDADRYGVTTLSVTVDKKGTAKLAGTFADGTSFTGSAPLALSEGPDGEWASVDVSIAPKSLAQGAMRISLSFYEEDGTVTLVCEAMAAKYVRTSGDYVESSLVCDWAYRYSSLAWVDSSVRAWDTCLSVMSDGGSFGETRFEWKKTGCCGLEKITGIGKKISGPAMTFKIDDKTGLFSGTCGSYKIFGAMKEGTCSGIGTAVGKDGSVGRVTVGVAWR